MRFHNHYNMRKNIGFRAWFYFRTGWSTYFAFVLAAINTLTVTYFLAIENIDGLKVIFPEFSTFVLTSVIVGIPLLTFIGYIHFKKSNSYKSEADIGFESNPHFLRILRNSEMILPYYVEILELLLRVSNNEKLNQEDVKKINQLKSQMNEHIDKKTL